MSHPSKGKKERKRNILDGINLSQNYRKNTENNRLKLIIIAQFSYFTIQFETVGRTLRLRGINHINHYML